MNIATFRLPVVLLLISFCVISSGCLRAYRPNIQQGNIVTTEMLELLEPGMSRREVRYTLGSPMIEDPFHADRWEYVYTLREGRSKKRQQSVVTVVFEDDRLASVNGNPELMEISEARGATRILGASTEKARNFWNRLFNRRIKTADN